MKRISLSLLVAGLIGSVGCTGMNPWAQDDGFPEPITPEGSLEPVQGTFDPTGEAAPAEELSRGGVTPAQADTPVFPEEINDANWTSQQDRLERELSRARGGSSEGFATGRR